MKWRLIIDDGADAADGLAADEALMLGYGRGLPQPDAAAALRLYTYRPHCALVGRYQALAAEVDLEACERRGISAGRRPTGGGAIIMGPEQLGVAITTRAPAGVSPRELMGRYASGLLAGLAGLGVRAGFRGKNDLEVAGRKIAGLGLYLNEDGALLFHASVLAGLDVELMLDVLRIPGAKLPNPADRPIARVHQRITTVSEQLSRTVAGADIRDAIADGFAATLDVRLEQSRLGDAEHRRATQLVAHRYACPEWLGGRELDAGARGTAGLKTPAGFVRVYAGVQRDALSGVMFTGDFSVIPRSLVALEAALRWCRVDHARIAALTERELDPTELAVEPGAVADAVYEAAKRAMARGAGGGRSEPARTAGSCYYPEREAEVRAA